MCAAPTTRSYVGDIVSLANWRPLHLRFIRVHSLKKQTNELVTGQRTLVLDLASYRKLNLSCNLANLIARHVISGRAVNASAFIVDNYDLVARHNAYNLYSADV